MPVTTPATQILATGNATVTLTENAAAALAALREEAARFFALDQAAKRRHGSDNSGFLPSGRAYSVTPDRPDLNDSFVYLGDDPSTVPDSGQIAPLMRALGTYWTVAAGIAESILRDMAAHCNYLNPLPSFRDSSALGINWYLQSTRDLLQDRHVDDNHLLTLIAPDSPGLEIETGEGMRPASIASNEILVISGGQLTAMTAGEVPPLYHQVRNHHLPRRISVMFAAVPPLDRVVPYA